MPKTENTLNIEDAPNEVFEVHRRKRPDVLYEQVAELITSDGREQGKILIDGEKNALRLKRKLTHNGVVTKATVNKPYDGFLYFQNKPSSD